MSLINTQQSPVQAQIQQEPPLPTLPLTSQNPTEATQAPVDQFVTPTTQTCSQAQVQSTAQASVVETTPAVIDEPEAAQEVEKKPWYAGIVNFFESLFEGLSAIFKAVAPFFKLFAPLMGPLAGLFGGLGQMGGSSSSANNSSSSNNSSISIPSSNTTTPSLEARPPGSAFGERGTGSVNVTGPLGIATGPVIDAPRASISSS